MFAINNCTCRLYSDANEYTWGKKDNASTASCYVPDWWPHPYGGRSPRVSTGAKNALMEENEHSPGPFSVLTDVKYFYHIASLTPPGTH